MSARTPSCLHCASPCSEHEFNYQSNFSDPALILDDIERLDKSIQRLHVLRSQRYQQLNAIRSSTRILPNEVLISIFECFCSLFEPYEFPQFILGGVCSHWRNLLNTEPLFWGSLHSFSVKKENMLSSASLLDVFKERNGASFGFLQIEFGEVDEQTSAYQRFLSSIRGISTISGASLEDSPADFIRIVIHELNTGYMCLNGLTYLIDEEEFISRLSLPWSTLTFLILYYIPVDVCFELLLGCPNLIKFTSSFPGEPAEGRIQPNTRHARETHFPHLQHLTWEHAYSEWDNTLLSFCRFPNLRHFGWRGIEHEYSLPLFSNFTSFLCRSCTFQLSGTQQNGAGLRMDIVRQIAYPVEELRCQIFNMDALPVALMALEDLTLIPSLIVFKWEYSGEKPYDVARDKLTEITRLFKNVVRGRKNAGAGWFRMDIEGIKLPEGSSRQSIYELMGGEFYFEIVEGDQVDCWKISS